MTLTASARRLIATLSYPRIVNYETGKAGAKARSLWRLEPLRIRWVEFNLSYVILRVFGFLVLLYIIREICHI